ncbi:MAG: RNA polymerase sigma factor [Stellaceae bacterium]
MNGPALERIFRAASGRIIAALAARFRDLTLAEDAFSEACLRALQAWPDRGMPDDPAAWLYRVADRIALDELRRQRIHQRHSAEAPLRESIGEDASTDDSRVIPDERLRLIFICCHPAVAPEARAALTLRLICGLTVTEIARAFLVEESTLAQRLVRAKRKIADAGVPFELPPPELWAERLEAVFSTLEVAYSKAHEDAAGTGAHAGFAAEMLQLTKLLVALIPEAGDAYALAALVHYAEARRPARVDTDGVMVPLSEQDPRRWRRDLIAEAEAFLAQAAIGAPSSARTLQATLQATWCARRSFDDPEPWRLVLDLYDRLLGVRDDAIVRLNRIVALAEVAGCAVALTELEALDGAQFERFAPYHAVRAELLAHIGRTSDARAAYEATLTLAPAAAEQLWLRRQLARLDRR